MVIEKNGIKISTRLNGRQLIFKVEEQSPEFTKILRQHKLLTDRATGLSLATNKRPSFNKANRHFFVRGTDSEYHHKETVVGFETKQQAEEGLWALDRLISKVVPAKIEHKKINFGGQTVWQGGTVCIRFAFINRAMATELRLTDHELYPVECPQWIKMEPFYENNVHAREHIAHAIDVMNKSVMTSEEYKVNQLENEIINQHRVSPEQARLAVSVFKNGFEEAFKGGYLVAYWRILSSYRSNDGNYPIDR